MYSTPLPTVVSTSAVSIDRSGIERPIRLNGYEASRVAGFWRQYDALGRLVVPAGIASLLLTGRPKASSLALRRRVLAMDAETGRNLPIEEVVTCDVEGQRPACRWKVVRE
jgi:hypothetical protein